MRASVIILAHGPEPALVECVTSVLPQTDEVLVVDNDAAPGPLAAVRELPGVRVLVPGRNLGYAAGCNYGADHANGDVLVFLNSDAVARPGAIEALRQRALDPTVGLASGSIRLADDPEVLNSCGNPVHFLMFSWVGGYGQPASEHARETEVASVSGVAFGVRRQVWRELGGFDPEYFAYGEDVYLSLRAWQLGYRVLHVPSAVIEHHYEFARNTDKVYLLERNRIMNLILLPEARTQRLLLLPALAAEAGVLVVATRDGWARQKVDGWRWLLSRRKDLSRRRRQIQADRAVPDRDLSYLARGALDPPQGLGPAVPPMVSRLLDGYWVRARARL